MIFKSNNEKDMSAMFVIFGGTGDLTHRKLIPGLYNLIYDKLLPENFAIVSIGRRKKTTDEYRDEIYKSLCKFSRNKIDESYWKILKEKIYYYRLDFTKIEDYKDLNIYLNIMDEKENTKGNRVYYLAVAPEYFETIVDGIQMAKMNIKEGSFNRLVIEKPFGKDLSTANQLNNKILEAFEEKDIYRIDHYLGKDMIQNIMVLRFTNMIFESLWSNKYIDNIQITLSEKNGVGTRGGYYEHSGAIRDMVQNHIIQILALVAMEPPVNLDTDSIRTEKLKVIQAIEEITPKYLRDNVVFGQYDKGMIDGEKVNSYNEEVNVPKDSETETFVAFKLHVNNYRWAGTPFYIRTGKRMASNSAEIVIQFKSLPKVLYFKDHNVQEPNLLVIRIQPNVGVLFQFNTKDFATHNDIVTNKMDTSHASHSQGNTPEAYERLIFDILRGDSTLFSRWDEVEAAWKFADEIISYREQRKVQFPNYESGTMGPIRSFELLAKDGREWWNIKN